MKSMYQEHVTFLMSLSDDELVLHGDVPDLLLEIGHADYTMKELRRVLTVTTGTESTAAAFYAQMDVLHKRGFVSHDEKGFLFLVPTKKKSA
jgi:hypothetical protein